MGASNPAWHDPVKAAQLSAQWVKGQTCHSRVRERILRDQGITQTAGQSPRRRSPRFRNPGGRRPAIRVSGRCTTRIVGRTLRRPPPRPPEGRPPRSRLPARQRSSIRRRSTGRNGRRSPGSSSRERRRHEPVRHRPKSSVPAGASLFGPGLLTTTAPNRADYTTATPAQSHPPAQAALQDLAGGTNLSRIPARAAGSGDVNPVAHGRKIGPYSQGVDANAAPGTRPRRERLRRETEDPQLVQRPAARAHAAHRRTEGREERWRHVGADRHRGFRRVGAADRRGQIVNPLRGQFGARVIEIGWRVADVVGRWDARAGNPTGGIRADQERRRRGRPC